MIEPTDNQDERDPLRAAFDEYQRAPRDRVPRSVEHTADDLRQLADGSQQVLVIHYELGMHGVTRHAEWATIAQPISSNREEKL